MLLSFGSVDQKQKLSFGHGTLHSSLICYHPFDEFSMEVKIEWIKFMRKTLG